MGLKIVFSEGWIFISNKGNSSANYIRYSLNFYLSVSYVCKAYLLKPLKIVGIAIHKESKSP